MLENYEPRTGQILSQQLPDSISCTHCKQRHVPCDYRKPACSNCLMDGITCRYETVPINVREIDARLRKLETALTAKQRSTHSLSSTDPSTIVPSSVSQETNHPTSQFCLAPAGIYIHTSITEPHHFIKLLFNGIDPTKIQQRAQDIFGRRPPSNQLNRTNTSPNIDSLSNDPLERSWFEMVLKKWHFRCFVIYQMVDRHWIIDHLFSEQIPLSQQQQLLAQSIRAYIYNHEDVLHDDTSYPMKNRKGELCFQQAQGLLETCYTISDRDTIRALLHLHMYQLQNGEVNGACQFIDLALRIAQDLKLNQLSTADDRKAEDDRRLWWSVYWTHLHMAAEYNRPMMVNDTACQIPYPHKLEDEKSDVGYCIDFSIHHLKLLKIHFMIAKKLRSKLTVNGLLSMVQDIERQLEEWKSQLPEHTIPEGWTDETDTLCIELAIILRCRLESTKIQMFECFQPLEDHTMSFMELLAIRNCMRAATNITDMLVGYGKGLRMCTCAGMLGVIRRCISVHMANSKSSIPEIAMTAKQKLQDMTGILSCHSFAYMHEANGLVATIQQSFSTTNQVEPVSTPLPSFINNPTPSTSATPPTLDLSQFQMTHPHLFNNLPETLNQAVDWTQSLGFPSSQQPQSSILPSPTFEQVQTATSLSSDTIGTAPIVEAVSLNHRLANPSAAFYQPVEGSHNDKMHRGMAPWAGIPSPLSSDMFDRNEYTRSLQPGWHPQQQ